MAKADDLQKEHEARLSALVTELVGREMIGHGHQLLHPGDPTAAAHRDPVH